MTRAFCSPRSASIQPDTNTKHRETCTTTKTSRKASLLLRHADASPFSTALGFIREACPAGARPNTIQAQKETTLANAKTLQSGFTTNVTVNSSRAPPQL